MSEIKVNKISQRSGTAITLGNSGTDFQLPSGADILAQSGSTITIAAGATITNSGTATGFGPTGAVSWNTTAVTSSPLTAVNGVGYFINTSGGAITVNLPAGTAGSIVALADYAATWNTNNVTVNANGTDKIGGTASAPATLSTQGQSVTFVYVDSTRGWVNVGDATYIVGNAFVLATGGTITTSGDYKIHTFTGPGTFQVTNAGAPTGSNTVDYLVVAGGGGSAVNGGGGGAGGFRMSNSYSLPAPTTSPLASPTGIPVSITSYPITVGGGGTAAGPFPSTANTSGIPSVFSTITSTGGGRGSDQCATANGSPGGSGGGAKTPAGGTAGSGNTPPVSPSQGNPGGPGSGPGQTWTSGGGAGAAGTSSYPQVGGVGSYLSPSFAVACAGTTGPVPGVRYFAGGGGGANQCNPTSPSQHAGGAGGGGTGASVDTQNNTDGTTNTGGGAGSGNGGSGRGRAGGSGIVIIRYKFQ